MTVISSCDEAFAILSDPEASEEDTAAAEQYVADNGCAAGKPPVDDPQVPPVPAPTPTPTPTPPKE